MNWRSVGYDYTDRMDRKLHKSKEMQKKDKKDRIKKPANSIY